MLAGSISIFVCFKTTLLCFWLYYATYYNIRGSILFLRECLSLFFCILRTEEDRWDDPKYPAAAICWRAL